MRFSLLSDFLMLNRTRITISKFSDQLSADLFFLQDPCLQYEFKSDQECVSVKGRLSRALEIWKDIHAPQFILDVIEFGYILPLLLIPKPFTARNNSSALGQSAFVENAISNLIRQGCVTVVFGQPIIINPLSVSIQKSGKKRLILDPRHVNQFLYRKMFRCEDLRVAKEILSLADYMFSFTKSLYITTLIYFPIAESTFLFRGHFLAVVTGFFQFSVLPFGFSSPPYLFTKLFKPLIKKWSSQTH